MNDPITVRSADGPIWLLLDSRAIGGIETHVLALARGLRSRGIDARIILLDDHGRHPMEDRLDPDSPPIRRLDGRLSTLARVLARERPAVLHTHGYKAGILGRLAALMTRTACVSTYHSGDAGLGMLRLYTMIDRLTAPLGHAVAVNKAIAGGVLGGAVVIANGVAVPPAPPVARGRQVAFVGRLSVEKGPDLFCELAERMPQLDWHVFGDGPMRGSLTERYGDRVAFHGAVPTLDPHWPEIGLLVMSSRAEGLPMAALEAMAHGVPVAAFDVGALAALTEGDRGWCVAPDDLDGLAAAIADWQEETPALAARRAEDCHAHVRARYGVERMVESVLDVYGSATDRQSVREAAC